MTHASTNDMFLYTCYKRFHFGNLGGFFRLSSILKSFVISLWVYKHVSTGKNCLISLEPFSVNYELNIKGKRMLTKLGTIKLRAIRTFSARKCVLSISPCKSHMTVVVVLCVCTNLTGTWSGLGGV